MKKMSIAADAGLNATGFYNRKSGSIRVSGAAEEVDELDEEIDELEEVDEEAVEAAEADDAVEDADDTADEVVVEEVLAEVKAETAESISELEEDTVSEALDDDEGEGKDDTTSVADDEATQHPAEEVQEKEGDNMTDNNRIAGISLKFLDNIRDYAYTAAIDGRLSPELGEFSLGIIKAYPKAFEATDIVETIKSVLKARPELIDELVDWADAYVEENTLPDYGWRYKAVGILNGKTFDSEAEARNAAADFIQLGHSFEELFVKDLFYREGGKLTERIPDGSKHRELILEHIKSSQPSANPADDR